MLLRRSRLSDVGCNVDIRIVATGVDISTSSSFVSKVAVVAVVLIVAYVPSGFVIIVVSVTRSEIMVSRINIIKKGS